MIARIIKKTSLKEHNEIEQNLAFWLSKDPSERVSAVEILRRQLHGDSVRLHRTVKIIQRS